MPAMKRALVGICAASILPLIASAATCEELAKLTLADGTITFAKSMPAGVFQPPSGPPIANLPAFCQVHGVLKPTDVSVIHFEVWMPSAGWNGKFEGVGNGGLAG